MYDLTGLEIIQDYPANTILAMNSAEKAYEQVQPRAMRFDELEHDRPNFIQNTFYSYSFHFGDLGSGAYGQVFKVKLKDGNQVAIKRFSSSSEFNTEKIKHLKLKHPNIIQLIGFVEGGGLSCLVLELAKMTLHQYLRDNQNSKRKADDCLQFSKDIVHGVAYLHFQGIIHGDLKTNNILIVEGNAKLCDFGQSQQLFKNEEGEYSGHSRESIGTTSYLPPETQNIDMREGWEFTTRHDIYPLSLMLCLLATKAKICPEYSNTPAPTLWDWLTNPRPVASLEPSNKVPPSAPVHWQWLIHRGLNQKPECRPDIKEFLAAVNEPSFQLRK